jgi:alpha-galactosidase
MLAATAASRAATAAAAGPGGSTVRVFILAGQSNMEGKAKVSLLNFQATQPATRERFARYRKDDAWIEREDVRIKFLERHGRLTVGYGSPQCIGPELAFGWTVGDRLNEPVLLIKTAWGGRSLWQDFRPPSAGLPPDDVLQKMLAEQQKRNPSATLAEIRKPFGESYRAMLEDITNTLAHLDQFVPGHAPREAVLAGFIWFQGWNDMISREYTAEYPTNLVRFIRDVRRDLQKPALPFVIAQMGVDGTNANRNIETFKAAQAVPAALPEFAGNVALVRTDRFWDTEAEAVFKKGWQKNLEAWNKVGSDFPYHYLGSARTLCDIGDACAQAVLDLGK